MKPEQCECGWEPNILSNGLRIACSNCLRSGPFSPTPEVALRAWNKLCLPPEIHQVNYDNGVDDAKFWARINGTLRKLCSLGHEIESIEHQHYTFDNVHCVSVLIHFIEVSETTHD
jgi:hypothetical protein